MSDSVNSPVNDHMSNTGSKFWPQLRSHFSERMGTYIVTTVFTIVTVFSDTLAGNIRSALNRADARDEKYAVLSRQLSDYLFECKLIEEYLNNGWTTREAFTPIVLDYNNDITDLRKNEYVDRAILAKYWNKDRRAEFVTIMNDIHGVDSTIHSLNDEMEQVNILKTKEKIDPVRAKSTATDLQNKLALLTPETEGLLDKLE